MLLLSRLSLTHSVSGKQMKLDMLKYKDYYRFWQEWADLSFRKRGNRCEHLENEALSAQKHRFRNALARADGLRAYKEQAEGCKIFEFAGKITTVQHLKYF